MRRTFLAAATLLLAASLGAQDVKPGVHGGLCVPVGDLSDALGSTFGITLGAHAGIYYGGGHELRPRFDLTRFEGGWQPVGDNKFTKNTITAWWPRPVAK